MSDLPFHQQQLEFSTHLAHNRIPLLDPFFQFLNYFDTPYFFFVLIPIMWLGYSYQWGIRIFYWYALNSLVNTLAKNFIHWPRPSTDLPEIGLFHPTDPGFPSGGAQICLFLGGLLIYYWRTRTAYILGITYILLISFSRLYLGVHYPIDILGGWALALILLALLLKTKEPLERFLSKKTRLSNLVLSQAIPLALMLFVQIPRIYYICGATMGVGLGIYFSLKNHLFLPNPKSLSESFIRSLIGIAMIFLTVLLWPANLPLFSKSFTIGLFISLAASPLCKLLYRPYNE